MLKYAIQTGKMNEMMERLSRVLNLRITFFDLQESELEGFNVKGMSPFCRRSRQRRDFNDACVRCDQEHLLAAKRTQEVRIYHCHAGLLEGIVPLYDKHRAYLGAIVFGQLIDKERPPERSGGEAGRLLSRSRKATRREMHDVGALLKYSSEYIIENEIVQYCNKPWAERLEAFIRQNLDRRLTLSMLAKEAGRSISFLSHNFPLEFGAPVKEYVVKARMEKAKELLKSGLDVAETAFKLGFYDGFHFSKAFKRHFGAPPSAYKKRGSLEEAPDAQSL